MGRFILSFIFILTTIILYLLMSRIYERYRLPFLLPALTTTLLVIMLLTFTRISYDTYMAGGKWIDALLGPAVVALAYPLYSQRAILFRQFLPILGGTLAGTLTGISTGLLMAWPLGYSRQLLLSLLPKSVTTPVAVGIADSLGGLPSLAVLFVMTAGFTGAVAGPFLFRVFKIKSSFARGMAFGSGSHVIGTSKAVEYDEYTTSVSSIAMTLSAVSCSLIAPAALYLFFH